MRQTSITAASIEAAKHRRLNTRIGLIHGWDQLKEVPWLDSGPAVPVYLGNNDAYELLFKIRETYRLGCERVTLAPSYFRQKRRWRLDNLDAVFVSISDPDQNPKVSKIAQRVLANARIPVINHPVHTQRTTRSKIAEAFADVPGVVMPKTVRIEKPRADLALRRMETEAMGFPVIVRSVGSHAGQNTALCDDADAVAAALNDAKGAHYLTEFVDFRSADGLYRKCRFFRIGREVLFRHQYMSDNWFIHSRDNIRFMARNPELIAEERSIYEQGIEIRHPGASERIRRLTEATGLDYVGIDCAFLEDGRILVFEINATMDFYPFRTGVFEYTKACEAPAASAFRELLEAKIGRPLVPR